MVRTRTATAPFIFHLSMFFSRKVALLAILCLLRGGEASMLSPAPSLVSRKHEVFPTKTIDTRGGATNIESATPSKNRRPTSTTTTTTTQGTATISNEILNLVKSVVGAGVLGLPSGIAAFANSPQTLLPVTLLVLLVGTSSGYCFSLIGRVCAYTNSQSYREAWSKSVSSKTSWMPAVGCLLVTWCSVLAYSMILSDTLPPLADAFLGIVLTRTQALIGVTIFAILPLCLLKDMSSLAIFSFLGTAGMIYTAIAMGIRYFDGSYALPDGKFLSSAKVQPTFGSQDSIWNPNVFLLLSVLNSALMCHYNAPRFYYELKDATIQRYNAVVVPSFALAIGIFCAFAALGFLTFGANSSGLILNDYSTQDKLMSMSRLAVASSIVFGYPLAFVGVRDGVLDLWKVKNRSDSALNTLTVGLLTVVTIMAFFVKNLRSVLSLGGATWGVCVCSLFPTYMFYKLADKMPSLKKERPIVAATGMAGVVTGVVGTMRAIKAMQS